MLGENVFSHKLKILVTEKVKSNSQKDIDMLSAGAEFQQETKQSQGREGKRRYFLVEIMGRKVSLRT